MEVADQWRREWAGTAEYGKVTEGGVTRRVARAMEVLHASGPGARVRVMRAAYHSSAGPGAPAESFMLHSSRRVISSGFNFPLMETPSLPNKPLEISSTPFELNIDSNGETENYKVTEPDDLEISEPSKWRGSTKGSSIRMPSEESSSTDNASIIDLDAKSKNLHRKYSYDSESSDVQFRSRSSSRTSQILDAPTSLSTLKYKSLLNNSNDWNTRRKSYSFEDTSPLNETIVHKNDTLAMESSTDSGICKSTEIVNDQVDDNSHIKYFGKEERRTPNKEESFRDWLSKNRQTSQYRGTKFKSYREHEIVMEEPKENNIALQSSGKVSITLPVTVETDNDVSKMTEDAERKVKRVEFCKTEVHFAAESGKVNIIATDEKPPPSNDFRKRRSAFVPMQDMIDRPITLFGEKNEFPTTNGIGPSSTYSNGDYSESDENTAATKSILKNKIPKPKPYLLGENMDFGNSNGVSNISTSNSILTAVSLVNHQLEAEKRYRGEIKSIYSREQEMNTNNNNVFRTINAGPNLNTNSNQDDKRSVITNIKIERANEETTTEDVKSKLSSLHVSPVQVKPKTRQLRNSDLTYFGVDSDRKTNNKDTFKTIEHKFSHNNVIDDIFHSVKMVQKVSNSLTNSVCNSEAESEEAPEYMNIPMNMNYAPIPTPRSRSRFDIEPNEINQVRAALKPIVENEIDETKDSLKSSPRRSRIRKQEEVKSSRSISEPPKHFKRSPVEKSHRRIENAISTSKHQSVGENIKKCIKETTTSERNLSDEDIPIYANLHIDTDKRRLVIEKPRGTSSVLRQRDMVKSDVSRSGRNRDISERSHIQKVREHRPDLRTDNSLKQKHSVNKDTLSSSLKKETRSEKVNKSHYINDTQRQLNEDQVSAQHAQKNRESDHHNKKEKTAHISRSLQRSSQETKSEEPGEASRDHSLKNRDTSSHRKRNLSKDKTKTISENTKPSPAASSDSSPRRSSAQTKSYQKEKEFGSKHHGHKANKHREYVINYDDKNGTVSSICKIKPAFGTPKRKKTSKEILKENNKDNASKTKIVDKIALRK